MSERPPPSTETAADAARSTPPNAAPLRLVPAAKRAWVTLAVVAAAVVLFLYVERPFAARQRSELVGTEAPDFALPVIYGGDPGNRIRLSDLRGRVVVLDFWASWCAPCEQQARELDSLARRQSEGVQILGVATGDTADAAARRAHRDSLTYPSVCDTHGDVAVAYAATDLPTVVVVDQKGTITAVRTGIVDASTVAELISQAK